MKVRKWKNKKQKNLKAAFLTLQASVSILNGKVHDSTIRKRLHKYVLLERVASSLEIEQCLKLHLKIKKKNPQDFWYNVFCTKQTKNGDVCL